jgi:lysophospholipase L1-like esterase
MKTIVCFGDSNTHGTIPMRDTADRQRYGRERRWPGILAQVLGAQWRVIEEGLPGRTTVHDDPIEGRHKNGMLALPMVLETHRPVDILVIMLGTNDLKMRFTVTAFDIAASAGKLVEFALASECGPDGGAPSILLVSPPPIIEAGCLEGMFEGGEAKSRTLSKHHVRVAKDLGCRHLDAGRIINTSPLDGVHFDEAAHEALGRAIAAEIAVMDAEGQSTG